MYLGGDERTDERGNSVEGLGKVETEGGLLRRTEDSHVRVGGDLEGGESAGD